MNHFRLTEYDYNTSNELIKGVIANYLTEHLSEVKSSKNDTIDQLMYEISQYKIKVFIAYDGGYPFGIIACSTSTFFYHQILRFIFLESKFQTNEVYNSLFDLLIQVTGYKGLAIISQNPIADDYIDSGFFQVDYKNSEKSFIYLRTLDQTHKLNNEEYLQKNVKYMKRFILLYSSLFYTVVLFILSMVFTLLYIFNHSVGYLTRIAPLLISIGLFALAFLFKHFLKQHNTKGYVAFGFQYDMVHINRFQYKFRSKTKEIFISCVQALLDSRI